MKRTLCLFLALILAVGICFSAPVTITASAAEAADIIVTIDTDLSVTLKDADGDGYYDIGTADELYAFATAVNGGNTSINGELTANITINENVLTADGELNDDGSNFRVWTPIGKGSNEYIGTFDGGDNTVSGLYCNDSEYNGVGLFGYVGSAGNVKNVGVIDSYISGNKVVGGVAGSIISGFVINCYNTGTIVGKQYVGGVVGENFGDVNECYNTGIVKGGDYVGGVVGYSSSNTSNCYNTGTIKGDNYVGGVVGYNRNGYVGDCYNTSNVTATNARVGGVVGGSNHEVANCYFNNENFTGDAIGDSEGGVANNVEPKTVEQFASGEVAYLFQQSVEDEAFDRRVWGQKIGEDAFPVFATESNKVYKNQTGGCNEATYTYEYSNIEKASVTTHTPAENAIYTDNGNGTHSFECSVCVNTVIEDHTGGTATCTTLAVCENCGDSYGDFAPHTYINGKCTAEGCGYACAHENNKDENGICTVCCIAEGTCSENVTWIYDSKRTTLTISGTGGMTTTAPWKNYRSEIKTVVINNGVTTIGDAAFFNCTSLTTIEIPDSVTTIGDYAFAICTSLVSVTIPGSVTTIGECAFSDCEKLTSITIPQSVTTIGECAFSNCEKLTSITIPQSVTSIGYYAFSSCTELTEIKVAEGNTNYLSVDGILFNADKTELICYPAGKKGNYEIPTTVTEIAPEAFLENTLLESVTIPVSVTSIGKNAFQACSELTSVTIPESVTSIGKNAFSNCKKLILTVESGSYAHNYAKTNSIPYIFNGYNEAETAQIEKLIFTLNADSESYSVTGCDTQISGELKIPATYNGKPVTEIGNYAFSACTALATVTIPDSVTTIGNYAFCDCTALTSVTIPDSVKTIGEGAFKDCTALTSVTIPDSVTTIGDAAFVSCTKLTTIKIPDNVKTIGVLAFSDCSLLKSVTIGNSVETIGDNAFYYCTSLASVTIPDSVKTIGGEAFRDCVALETVTIGGSVETIGDNAFKGCTALKTVEIPDSVTSIDSYAFQNCILLTSVTISYSETKIGECAFAGCPSLETVNVPCDWNTENPPYAFDENVLKKYHNIVTDEAVEATCTKTGLTEGSHCSRCDDKTVAQEVVPALNHKGTLVQVEAKAKTCTTVGWEAYEYCTACDYTTYVEIPASHEIVKVNAKAKTCKEAGHNAHEYCTGCDYTTKVEIPASHELQEVEAKAPTCTEIGYDAYEYCTACTYTTYKEKAALNHNIVIDKAVAPDCKNTGLKEGSHCSRCDNMTIAQEVVPALNHKDTLVRVEAKAKTCTTVGWEAYEYCTACDYTTKVEIPASHEIVKVNAKAKTCTEAGHNAHEYCTECDYTTKVVIPASHEIVKVNAKAKTCKEAGHNAYEYCTACDYTTKVEIPASHELQEVEAKAPTCEAIGYDAYKYCTECDYTTYVEKAKLGHDIVIDKAVAATCTKTGLTEGSHCSRCNGATKAQQAVAATGHKPVVIGAKPATCSQEGYTGDTQCSVCKASISTGIKVAKLAHKLTLVGKKAATFETEGHTGAEVCSVCKQTINAGSVIKKLTFTTPEVTVEATDKGVKVTWNKVENAQSYIVYKRVYNESTEKWSGWEIINGNATELSLEDSNVTLGTKYRYTVRAKNGNTLSPYKSTGTVKYNVIPTVKVANATGGIKVSWSTAANATGYRVYRSTLSNGKWSGWKNMGTAKANKTAWTDKSVKTGVTYKYTVRAVYNKVLSSYNKDGAVSLFLSTPAVKIANIANGIQVKWNSVSGATGYIVYSSQFDPVTNKWSGWANRGTVTTTSWTDTTVKSGVTYKYTVRALNGNTLSAYKATGGLIYLAEPTVKISNAAKGIKVKWSQCDGATGYTVYRSEYNSETKKWSGWKSRGTAAATKSSWTDKKVTSGKTYKYTVRAVNGNFKSSYVSTGSLLYLAQPTVTVKAVDNGINVAWTQHSGATGYRVYRSELVNGEWSKWKSMGTAKANKNNWTDKSAEKGKTYKYTVRTVNGKTLSSYADGTAVSS